MSDAYFDDWTIDRAARRAETQSSETVLEVSLGSMLSAELVELILERSDARRPSRSIGVWAPAMAVSVRVSAIDLGARRGAAAAIPDLAALVLTTFVDGGFCAIIEPGGGPIFVRLLPAVDPDADEVTTMCRQLDEDQIRAQVLAVAERFRAAVERRPGLRELVVEVRLGEGAIVGAPEHIGALLAASMWRPA
ncbi:MAG: hypothetical protein K8W52_17025 [Deltaproteobacteria bacterium]|nr:hypothetical protein [Deltaproteobacteria bacterium]